MRIAEEDGIVDTVVEAMGAEEAAGRCSLEDCILAGLACMHSHFAVEEEEELNEGVVAV